MNGLTSRNWEYIRILYFRETSSLYLQHEASVRDDAGVAVRFGKRRWDGVLYFHIRGMPHFYKFSYADYVDCLLIYAPQLTDEILKYEPYILLDGHDEEE